MIGVLLQDEKVPGVHLAFGDPYGSQTHADWSSKTHVDVLTRDCDVWIDDEQVIAAGQYLLDRFELGEYLAALTDCGAHDDPPGARRLPRINRARRFRVR